MHGDATLSTIEISAPVAHTTYATGRHANRNMYILSRCFKVVWHKVLSKVPLKIPKGCLQWDQTTSSTNRESIHDAIPYYKGEDCTPP